MLEMMARNAGLFLICVNRPGQFGTALPTDASGGTKPASMIGAAAGDVVAVLDELKIENASVLCISSGTPWGLAFASKYPKRTTGRILGAGCWLPPFDISSSLEKRKVNSRSVPTYLGCKVQRSLLQLGGEITIDDVRKELSDEEQEQFDTLIGAGDDKHRWLHQLRWSLREHHVGAAADEKTLISGSASGGIDYTTLKLPRSGFAAIAFFHGTDDKQMSIGLVEAFVHHLGAKLVRISHGSHEGLGLLLHPLIRIQGLQMLADNSIRGHIGGVNEEGQSNSSQNSLTDKGNDPEDLKNFDEVVQNQAAKAAANGRRKDSYNRTSVRLQESLFNRFATPMNM